MNENNLEKSNKINDLMKKARIKECLWCGDTKNIIRAHSIQNNKILNKVGDNGKLISIRVKVNHNNSLPIPRETSYGKNNASTFTGYCSIHDKSIFQEIEDFEYKEENFQNLLFLIRAISREFHAKKESCNLIQILEEKNPENKNKNDFITHKNNEKISYDIFNNRFSALKKIYENYMNTKDSLEIEKLITTKVFKFEGEYLLATNRVFYPDKLDDNSDCFDKDTYDKIQKGEIDPCICLNVFPENNNTFIIISYFNDSEKFLKKFLERLNWVKENNKIDSFVSFLLIEYCENTYINPNLWESFSDDEKNKIITHYSSTLPTLYSNDDNRISNINLFKKSN